MVRVIEYRLTGLPKAEPLYRLITTLLDPVAAPAVELAAREAVAFFRESGDQCGLGEELHHMGTMAWVFSDYDAAERWCEESRAIAEQTVRFYQDLVGG